MPIQDLISGLRGIEISPNIKEVSLKLVYRDFISVGILVSRLEIDNNTKIKTINNIIPDTWIYIQEPSVRIGRLQVFNNWYPYLVDDFERDIWLGIEFFCSEGDELWSMTNDQIKNLAVNELQSIGIIEKSNLKDAVVHREKKAYPSYHGSYKYFGVIRNFLDTIPNLFCLGRNGQHRYNNMDHSMLTAFEAVRLLEQGVFDKQTLWAVNSEKIYAEKR